MGQKVHPLGFRLGITYEHKGQWFEEMKTYSDSVYQDFVLRNCLLNSFKNADITSIDIERSFNQVVIKVTAARSRLLISNIKHITNYLNALLKFMALAQRGGNNLTTTTALANINLTKNSLATLNKWNSKIAHQKHLLRARASADLVYLSKNHSLSPTNAPVGDEGTAKGAGAGVLDASNGEPIDSSRISEQTVGEENAVQNFPGYEPRLSLLLGSSSQESIANSAFLTAKSIQEQLEKRVPFRRAVKVAIGKAAAPKGIKIQVSGRLNGAEIARSEWIRQGRVPLHTLRAQVDYCSHQARTQYGILGIKVWIFRGYQE